MGNHDLGPSTGCRSPRTQLSEALRQWERLVGPVMRRLKEWSDAAAPHLQAFREWNRTVDALNEVGWLPYHSASFHYVEECGDDLLLLERRFSEYYRTRWREIRDDMESRLEDYHIDDEARETFREALSAHEAGYYRCVCRVVVSGNREDDQCRLTTFETHARETDRNGRLGGFCFQRTIRLGLVRPTCEPHVRVGRPGRPGKVRAGSGPKSSRRHAWIGTVFDAQAQHEHTDLDGLRLSDPSSDEDGPDIVGRHRRDVLRFTLDRPRFAHRLDLTCCVKDRFCNSLAPDVFART